MLYRSCLFQYVVSQVPSANSVVLADIAESRFQLFFSTLSLINLPLLKSYHFQAVFYK